MLAIVNQAIGICISIDLYGGAFSLYWNTSRTGSWNAFTNNKLYYVNWYENNALTGNLEIWFASSGKGLYYIWYWNHAGSKTYYYNISGSISVWSECYDLEKIWVDGCDFTGTISMLGKLQKLYYVDFRVWGTAITGVKTDLYNNGANITYFNLKNY